VEEGLTKGKQVNHQIYGRMINYHLSLFPRKSGTETVVMTEEKRTVETTGVM
jgi:folate-dependent phosphoribosylglycinamide formyltransferase PurN